jgi:hypothetical protein
MNSVQLASLVAFYIVCEEVSHWRHIGRLRGAFDNVEIGFLKVLDFESAWDHLVVGVGFCIAALRPERISIPSQEHWLPVRIIEVVALIAILI